jgi:hypothetical protein
VDLQVVTAEEWFDQHSKQVGSTDGYLWGPHIRKEAVTLFVGEKSVGKTTLLYNLCFKLSNGDAFLDTAPPRPLRILHFDYEVDDQTRVDTMFNIGHRSKNWAFPARDIDGGDINGAELFHKLETMTPGEYDIVIADPLCDAYPVKNENDNEEANVQMRRFRRLARSKHVAVVLIHNTGRPPFNPKGGEQSAVDRATKKHMGRGATARADRADIVMNYVAVDKTTRMLCVAGSRTPGHLGHQWTLEFDGNHGLRVCNQSHSHSHESHTLCENGNGNDTLSVILQEHVGMDLLSIYEQFIKGPLQMSRSTFYRRVQAYRNLSTPPEASPSP